MWIQLRRPSDGAMSEPRPFQFIPKDTGSVGDCRSNSAANLISKRFKPDFQLYSHILATDAAILARNMFRAAGPTSTLLPPPPPSPPPHIVPQLKSTSVQCEILSSDAETNVTVEDLLAFFVSQNASVVPSSFVDVADLTEKETRLPPPLPQKGVKFDKLKGDATSSSCQLLRNPYAKVNKVPVVKSTSFDRISASASASASDSESESDARFSLACSEDLNSRLSAAFSEFSDLTDAHSCGEVDASDVEIDVDIVSVLSSSHTLNDRLSLLSLLSADRRDSDSDRSDSDQTVIDSRSDSRASVDTIEKQLEMLQSMSVESDYPTYSSFHMAMRSPLQSWPLPSGRAVEPPPPLDDVNDEDSVIQVDLVYDDPSDEILVKSSPYDVALPVVPPRIESKTVPTPPLPPRRFKKMNQPLPDPPAKDLGLKSALLALKQTFMKKSQVKNETLAASNLASQSSFSSSQNTIRSCSQENVSDIGDQSENAGDVDQAKETGSTSATPSDAMAAAVAAVESAIIDPSDGLTEAENYALYMRLAPLATASEFDESETLSAFYADLSPVRGANNNNNNNNHRPIEGK